MSEFTALMDQLRNAGSVDPTDRLREAIEAGLIESNSHSKNEKFLTIPFLLLGLLYVGKHRPKENDFVTNFYREFGPEETEKLKKRVHNYSLLKPHSSNQLDNLQVLEIPWISPECLDALKVSQDPMGVFLRKSTSEDIMLNILEKRPQECINLFEDHTYIWELFISAAQKSLLAIVNSGSIKTRVAKLLPNLSLQQTDKNRKATRTPSKSIEEWRSYLENRYKKIFSQGVCSMIIATIDAALREQGDISRVITISSKYLLISLLQGPLKGLLPEFYKDVNAGMEDWFEPQSYFNETEKTQIVFGSTRPSVEFEIILQTAANLTDTTIGYPEVTEWHLAFAAVSSGATGIRGQREAQKSSLKVAADVLKTNMTNQVPDLASRFDWSLLDQANSSRSQKANKTSSDAGTKFDYSRDSTQEEIDDVTNKLARAIASTFKSSNNKEFCFALFGPWGRGKTTLIRQVSKELEQDFVSVAFNAWKYPTRPEVWVWLYETIKQKAYSQSFWNGLKLGVQCKLRQDNGIPLIFPAMVLLFSAFSKWTIFSKVIPIPPAPLEPSYWAIITGQFWAMILDVVFAVVSIIIIWLYGKTLWNGFGTTLANYVHLPNHGRHLGLQAAIGDDLKRLVSAWTATNPSTPETDEAVKKLPQCWFTHALELARIHWGFLVGFILLELSLVVLLLRIWNQAPPVLLWLVIFSLIVTPVIFFFLLSPVRRANKVLLLVDDLDRCPPDEMLAVIESLRVFLEEPMIEKNLKIAMLLDRDILSHAICSKYEKLIRKDDIINDEQKQLKDAPSRFTNSGIVAEQIEKYFILSLDLPPLASDSAYSIASKIVGYSSQSKEPAPESSDHSDHDTIVDEESTTPNHGATVESIETADTKISAQNANSTGSAVEPAAVEEVLLTEEEKKSMVRLLHSLLVTEPAHATPRRMRMIKMRYFLARQILREQGISFNPEELLKHFSGHFIDRKLEPKLAEIVGMVTGKVPEL